MKRKNKEFNHLKSKFDEINNRLKTRIHSKKANLEHFKQGVAKEINSSLSLFDPKTIVSSYSNTNYLSKFNEIIRNGVYRRASANNSNLYNSKYLTR